MHDRNTSPFYALRYVPACAAFCGSSTQPAMSRTGARLLSGFRLLSRLFAVLLCVNLLAGCSSVEQQRAAQAQAAANTLRWLGAQHGFLQSSSLERILSRVTDSLSRTVFRAALETDFDRDNAAQFQHYAWQTIALDTDAVNAFCLGNGTIVVTRGLLLRTLSESSFAAVVAHEMAHQLLGHPAHALAASAENPSSAPAAFFTLDQELAADSLALKIIALAGYRPQDAAQALTINYRPLSADVAPLPPRWLELRLANFHQQLHANPPSLPGTATTRDFSRVQRELAGY